MPEDMGDFAEEFQKLHDDSSYSNDNINTELDDTEDDDIKALKKYHKNKKDKKKDKKYKHDKLHFIMEDMGDQDDFGQKDSDDDISEIEDFIFSKKSKKGKKKDLFDIKQAKKAKKKNIDAKFTPQIAMLRKILKDADTTATDIRGVLDKILSSKSRYTGKSLTDLLQALNTANSNRASIVRDISNINKTIIDLKMKQDKANPKKEDENQDDEEYGINLFRRILSGNNSRRDMMESAKSFYNEQNVIDDLPEEDPDEIINARLNEENNERRSSEGTQYIRYESMEPRDVVVMQPDGSWEMDAVDKDDNPMPDDYPRLTMEDVGNMRFDMDTKSALDSYGRRYDII